MSNQNRKQELKRLHFIADIIAVFRKHGLSLSHEDEYGAFLIEGISDRNIEWLQQASFVDDSCSSFTQSKANPPQGIHVNKTLIEYFGEKSK